MPYETQFGDRPTHVLPTPTEEQKDEVGHAILVTHIDKGQSVPAVGTTKHLWHGPSTIVVEHTRGMTRGVEFHRATDDERWYETTPRIDEWYREGVVDVAHVVPPVPNE